MSHVPLPIRVAAGLLATAVEEARRLPEQLSELPVTAVSRAIQSGMRWQQRVTELAVKGDEVLSLLRPVEDTPAWARFDEDDEAREAPATTPAEPGPDEYDGLATVVPGPGLRGHEEVDAEPGRAGAEAGSEAADAGARNGVADPAAASAAASGTAAGTGPGPAEREAPSALPEYDQLSLPQLRGKLRSLTLPQLEALLEHENATQARPPFVTMLSNRIVTVRSQ